MPAANYDCNRAEKVRDAEGSHDVSLWELLLGPERAFCQHSILLRQCHGSGTVWW
jgi:hypothetical protein